MILLKKKVNQIELANGIFEYVRQARFRDIAISKLPQGTSNHIVDKLFRAQIYLVIISTINYYPEKYIAQSALKFLIYENLFNEEFNSYDEFCIYFDKDFQEFEKMLHFGETSGNTMFFGISRWIFEEPECNVDPIEQFKIIPHLFTLFDSISEAHKSNQKKFKVID